MLTAVKAGHRRLFSIFTAANSAFSFRDLHWTALNHPKVGHFTPHTVESCSKVRQLVTRAGNAQSAFEQFLAVNPPHAKEKEPELAQAQEEFQFSREERLHWKQAAAVLREELSRGDVAWDARAHAFVCRRNPGKSTALLQMPRILPEPDGQAPEAYLQSISDAKGRTRLPNTLMVLLSADSAVLGIYEGDVLRKHKVFTGYTVRKNRGGSQLKYLRQGGPGHSVGGNMRRREAHRLFGEAAQRLQEWEPDIAECTQAFSSGDVRVWNLLYDAAGHRPPIGRNDPRWRRAGLSLRRPRQRDLRRLFNFLSFGALRTLAH